MAHARELDRIHQLARRLPWLGLFLKFIDNLRIDSKEVSAEDDRGTKLELWRPQRIFLEKLAEGLLNDQRMIYCLKSRQLGVSTITTALLLFFVAVRPRTIAALVCPDEEVRDAFRDTLNRYVASFPAKFFGDRFVKTRHNDKHFLFSNGSRIDYLIAGKRRTNWGESRGYSIALCTEIAKYGQIDGIRSFIEALAQANPDRLFIFESTAEGINHWHEMWHDAEDEPTINRIFIGWWAKELNVILRSSPLFQQYGHPPNGDETDLCNEVLELYGHVVTTEQLAWWRWKLAQGDRQTTDQNQPWCLVADTRVGTTNGILRIGDILANAETTRGKVLHSGQTGRATIWRAETKLGYQVRGTANHPLISARGEEVPLADAFGKTIRLQPPMLCQQPAYFAGWRDGPVSSFVEITADLARLVGLFMGDGSLSGTAGGRAGFGFQICCDTKDRDVVDECKRLVKSVFGIDPQERTHVDERFPNAKGWTAVRVTSRLIYETFQKLGLTKDAAGKRTQRRVSVPEFIWRSPKPVVREFLSGLFEADGFNSYKSHRVQLCAKDERFVKDIQLLLLAFGITARHARASVVHKNKKHSTNYLELRSEEAKKFNKEIGFISKRKRDRHANCPPKKKRGPGPQPIIFEDEVVDVSCEGVEQDVYNLTIDGDHLFDAGGVLTHNTARQAFVMSGYSFFPMRMLQTRYEEIYAQEIPFKGYRFIMGNTFWSMKLEPIREAERYDEIELKVFEEPKAEAQYVIGADPAYGSSEDSHYHGISVWRCYADKIVQVAEYADRHYETKHCAWVLAGLAGAYRNCMVNLELYGPGRIVMNEFDNIRNQLRQEIYNPLNEQNSWDDDFMAYARWFMYRRVDNPGPGFVYNFETSAKRKWELFNLFRDCFTSDILIINSVKCIEEMATYVQEKAEIAPQCPDTKKGHGDRAFAAALAVYAWNLWIRNPMIAAGATYQSVTAAANGQSTAATRMMDRLVYSYFQRREAEAEEAEDAPWGDERWRQERGLLS